MTFTVFGVTYAVDSAPAFVQHGIRLRTGRYGTDFDVATPNAVRHYAYSVGRRFGTVS